MESMFILPINGGSSISESDPIGYLVSPDERIFVFFSPLTNDLVQKGLRAIVTTILRAVFGRDFNNAKVLYNREENLTRYFAISLENDKFFVVGIVDLNRFEGPLGAYNEYFIRFVFTQKYEEAEEYLWLLKKIRKVESGTPVDPPYTEYVWGDRMGILWSVRVPPTAIIAPQEDGFLGMIGSVFIEVKLKAILKEYSDSIRYDVEEIVKKILDDGYEFYKDGEQGKWLHFKAFKGPMMGDIRVLITDTHINPEYLQARIYAFFYPRHIRSVAEKIMARIIATWYPRGRLIESLVPPPAPPEIPVAPTITSTPIIPTTRKETITERKTTKKNEYAEKMKLEECKRKKRELKMKIEDVKRKIRFLDRDYENYKTVYRSIKRGELITGFYTFKNPAGKTRLIHTKARSPILGDRFWEHKDVKYLDNKVFLVTRNIPPPHSHMFNELQWDVQKKIEQLEREYRQKRKALEEELKALEEQLRQLEC